MWCVSKSKWLYGLVAGVATLCFLSSTVSAADTIVQSQLCDPFNEPAITAPATATETEDDAIHVVGTADPGMTVSILRDSSTLGTVIADAGGSFALQVPLQGGDNLLFARVTNDCGTVKDSAGVVVHRIIAPGEPVPGSPPPGDGGPTAPPIDTPRPGSKSPDITPPTPGYMPPSIHDPKPGYRTQYSRTWVVGVAEAGSTVDIYVNGGFAARVTASASGTFGAIVGLRIGDNAIQVFAYLGSKSASSEIVHVTYTPRAPSPSVVRPGNAVLQIIILSICLGVVGLLVVVIWHIKRIRRRVK